MSCESILPSGTMAAFGLGLVSHLLYFIHGELNKQAGSIAIFFLSAWSALAILFVFFCLSFIRGVFIATVLVVSYQVGLGTSIITYRLAFHRTRRFPGPLLAAVTKWDAAYIACTTQRYHAYVLLLHRKYGDLVRTGPRELSLSNVEAIRAIYSGQSGCLKGPWYDMGGTGFNLHRTRDPELHAKQRPLWERGFRGTTPLFSPPHHGKTLSSDLDVVNGALEMSNHLWKVQLKTSHLVTRFGELNKGVDVVNEFELFAFKLMAFIIFSEDIDETARLARSFEDVYSSLRLSQQAIGIYGHVPWYYSVARKFPWLVPENNNFTQLAQEMVDRRQNKKPDVPDLFTYLLPTIDDPNSAGFPISWEARLAMVAGSGNVSSALLSTFFYLAKNPTILRQLQEEVDPLISSGEFDPKAGHPILNSILFETFRMQPLVPNGGERVSPSEGLIIGEHFIPANTVIKVPLYTIFRDPRYFERPEEWIPSRWTTDKSLVKDSSAFIPFSTGTYSCVGRPLGMVEIRDVIAQFAHAFDFKITEDRSPQGFENSGQDHFGMVFKPGSLFMDFEHR